MKGALFLVLFIGLFQLSPLFAMESDEYQDPPLPVITISRFIAKEKELWIGNNSNSYYDIFHLKKKFNIVQSIFEALDLMDKPLGFHYDRKCLAVEAVSQSLSSFCREIKLACGVKITFSYGAEDPNSICLTYTRNGEVPNLISSLATKVDQYPFTVNNATPISSDFLLFQYPIINVTPVGPNGSYCRSESTHIFSMVNGYERVAMGFQGDNSVLQRFYAKKSNYPIFKGSSEGTLRMRPDDWWKCCSSFSIYWADYTGRSQEQKDPD